MESIRLSIKRLGIRGEQEYQDILLFFTGVKDINNALETPNSELIKALFKRYKHIRPIDVDEIDISNSMGGWLWNNNLFEGQYKAEDLLTRLPYNDISVILLLVVTMMNEIDALINNYNSLKLKLDKVKQEFEKEFEYNKDYSIQTPHNLLIKCNIYMLAALIIPDYNKLIQNRAYRNYWPFGNNNIMQLIKNSLSDYTFTINTYRKLKLLTREKILYNKLKISEAISLRILLEILLEIEQEKEKEKSV